MSTGNHHDYWEYKNISLQSYPCNIDKRQRYAVGSTRFMARCSKRAWKLVEARDSHVEIDGSLSRLPLAPPRFRHISTNRDHSFSGPASTQDSHSRFPYTIDQAEMWLVRGNPARPHVVHGRAETLISAIDTSDSPLRKQAVRPVAYY